MNQILDFGDGNNNNNDNEKKKKKAVKEKNNSYEYNNNGKAPISDKIVKVFAFLMVVVAIGLIASGVMSILKNKKDSTPQTVSTPQIQAEILADLDEESGEVKITINNSIAISKVIYSWDQEYDHVIDGNKQTTIEKTDIVPFGEHVLHVQVTDEQNNKTTKDFTFNSETGMDTTPPNITLSITEDKKLSVTATDDTSIAYVTYTWNDGETVTMTPERENLKEYEFKIDIPKGKNTVVVIAVDGSDGSNAKTTSKVLEGVTKPNITCGLTDNYGSALQTTCTHENGIKSIYYVFNGQPYQWEVPEGEEAPKELSFTQESVAGHNEMTITVTSVDGTTADFHPVWDYNPAN